MAHILQSKALAANVVATFEGGPRNGDVAAFQAPGNQIAVAGGAHPGTYALSHEGAGGVLVYHWEG